MLAAKININVVIDPPAKARIKVLVIVPIISFPIFMELLNKSICLIFLFTSYISNKDDDIHIATSITAPSDAINIPANIIPLTLRFVPSAIYIRLSVSFIVIPEL